MVAIVSLHLSIVSIMFFLPVVVEVAGNGQLLVRRSWLIFTQHDWHLWACSVVTMVLLIVVVVIVRNFKGWWSLSLRRVKPLNVHIPKCVAGAVEAVVACVEVMMVGRDLAVKLINYVQSPLSFAQLWLRFGSVVPCLEEDNLLKMYWRIIPSF